MGGLINPLIFQQIFLVQPAHYILKEVDCDLPLGGGGLLSVVEVYEIVGFRQLLLVNPSTLRLGERAPLRERESPAPTEISLFFLPSFYPLAKPKGFFPLTTANSQQSTVNCQQSTVNSQQSTVNSQQSTVN